MLVLLLRAIDFVKYLDNDVRIGKKRCEFTVLEK